MQIHFWLIGLAGLCVALGLFYRIAAIALWALFLYVFLLDAAYYLNHFYLICLLSFLLVWLPADACFSIDSWRRSRKAGYLQPDACTVPFWSVFLIRAQLFVVYFYAGLAKLDPDWLACRPLNGLAERLLLFCQLHLPFADRIELAQLSFFLHYGGLVFDLSIGFLLLIRRTRILGIVLCLLFHGMNYFIFSIGVFPIMAFCATLIFLDTDWPRRLWAWAKRPRIHPPQWTWFFGGALAVPAIGAALGWKSNPSPRRAADKGTVLRCSNVVAILVCTWLAFHLLVPLRHLGIDGNAEWTEEGHRFSWRMMLHRKKLPVYGFTSTIGV
jgi:vitamin K-dependent gamma-carboxylase